MFGKGWSKCALVSVCVTLSSSWTAPVGAQAPAARAAAPSAAEKERARAWVAEGDRRFASKEYREALSLYQKAYELVHVPTVGLSVARTEAALGLLLQARATAGECARIPASSGEPAVFGRARTDARELEQKLASEIPTLALAISPPEARVEIQIDGSPRVGAGPLEVNPGRHQLRVHGPGYVDFEQAFESSKGEQLELAVALRARAGAAAGSEPGGPAPAVASSGGSTSAAMDSPSPGNGGALVRGYVALGVAGVGAVAGATTGILAFTSKPDCPGDVCPPGSESDISKSKLFGNIANVSFAVARIAALYGLWELAFNAGSAVESRGDAAAPVFAPTLHRAGAGAVVQGRF